MKGINRIEMVGRVEAFDLRYTPKGTAVLRITLAGENEAPWYHRLVVLGNGAEFWADRLEKGMTLMAEGRLSKREGRPLEVIVHRLELLGNEGSLNRVLLGGNLAKDPTLRKTATGREVLRFPLAVDGKGPTLFVDVEVWDTGDLGLKKGSPILVEGRLRRTGWMGEDGEKRYATRVLATTLRPVLKPTGTPALETQREPELAF